MCFLFISKVMCVGDNTFSVTGEMSLPTNSRLMNYFWDENLSVIYCRLINIQFEILTKNIKSLLCYSISHYEGNFHLFVFLYPQWLISGYINISHASININECLDCYNRNIYSVTKQALITSKLSVMNNLPLFYSSDIPSSGNTSLAMCFCPQSIRQDSRSSLA